MPKNPRSPDQLDKRATILLARAAFDDRAISPECFDFIIDYPSRVDEVLEFSEWLSGGSS